jgi:LruC domain-containing protein
MRTLDLKLFSALLAPALLFAPPALAQTVGASGVDSDADGVDDDLDAAPCDGHVSARIYAPADRTYGMLLFEDNWPDYGDFDFNDAVLAYNQTLRYDSGAALTGLRLDLSVMAVGAKFTNGLAFRLPGVPFDGIASLSFHVRNVATGALAQVNLQPGQTVEGDVIFILADDLHALFGEAGTKAWVNTEPGKPAYPYVDMVLDVSFLVGHPLSAADAPFDLFLFNLSRGSEVHLPRYRGTASMNAALYNTKADGSTAVRSFVTTEGIPFALDLPELADYPQEGVRIDQLYPEIVTFGASNGTQALQFYRNPAPGFAYGLVPPRALSGSAAADVSCFVPNPGVCGAASGVGSVDAPAANLCSVGAASAVSSSGGLFRWDCAGVYSQPTACTTPDWVCQPNIAAGCAVSGGTGSQTCNGSGTGYGTCTVTACNSGYYQSGNACLAQVCSPGSTASCTIPNGVGLDTCNSQGSAWGGCTVQTCNSGFQRNGNTCVAVPNQNGPITAGSTNAIATQGGWSVRCLAWSGRVCVRAQMKMECTVCATYPNCGVWHDITSYNNGSNRTAINYCAIATGSSTVNSVGFGSAAAQPYGCGWSATNHPICEAGRATYVVPNANIATTLGLLLNPTYCAGQTSLLTIDCAGW